MLRYDMDNQEQAKSGEKQAELQSGFDLGRRRLTGSALGASAILTLASRPVLAMDCVSPSGFASGNLSQHGTPAVCSGNGPTEWGGQNQNTYPSSVGNPKFKDVFSAWFGMG